VFNFIDNLTGQNADLSDATNISLGFNGVVITSSNNPNTAFNLDVLSVGGLIFFPNIVNIARGVYKLSLIFYTPISPQGIVFADPNDPEPLEVMIT